MICDSSRIEITMPGKAEYAQILRLAAAGAANGAGFDIEVVDDVKIVVSEIFNSIITAQIPVFKTFMHMEKGKLSIDFEVCQGNEILGGANEMTLPIIEALVKSVKCIDKNRISMVIE
jgi:serine/threonine-protein kinase RsbW